MDKETLIEMMKSEYPSSYEGIKDRINDMDVKEISDMMEFLDMSIGDQSRKQDSGIMATEDAQLTSLMIRWAQLLQVMKSWTIVL